MSKRYLQNTFYSALFFAVQLVVTVLISPFIIRSLGKESYGIIVTASTLSAFGWLSLMDLGVQGAATKFLSDAFGEGFSAQNRANDIFQAVTSFYVFCGLLSGGILFFLSSSPEYFTNNQALYPILSQALIVVGIFNFIIFPLMSMTAVAEGLQEYRYIKLSGVLVILLWVVAVLTILCMDGGLLFFIVADYAKVLLQHLLLSHFLKRRVPWLCLKFKLPRFNDIAQLFSLSIDMFVSRLTGLVFRQTDVLIITIVLGSVSLVTDYTSANVVFVTLIGFSAIFNAAVIPESSAIERFGSKKDLYRFAVAGSSLSATFIYPLVVVIFVWAPEILNSWLGPDYVKNSTLLRIMLLALVPVVANGVTSTMLVGINRLRGALWIPVSSVFINLLISLGGLKTFGIISLGLGTTLAYWISWIFYGFYIKRILNIKYIEFIRDALCIPFLVSLFYGGCSFFLKEYSIKFYNQNFLLMILLCAIITYTTIYLLSSCEKREAIKTIVGL